MKVTILNSNTIGVEILKESFTNSLPEIEKIAQNIGQYGNIINYETSFSDRKATIVFKLDKPYKSAQDIQPGDEFLNKEDNSVVQVQNIVNTDQGESFIEIQGDPLTQESIAIEQQDFLNDFGTNLTKIDKSTF